MAKKIAAKSVQQKFEIMAKVTVDISVMIAADRLSEAVETANTMCIEEFITPMGSVIDQNLEITGVFKS